MALASNNPGWEPLQFHHSHSYSEPQISAIGSSYDRAPNSMGLKRKPSLAGKAIKALGAFADRVLVQTRIKTAFSCFPHTDSQGEKIKGIWKLYDTLLDLSRPGVYQPELREPAKKLLIGQIRTGHTHQLVRALGRWNIIELEIFLFGLVESSILSKGRTTGRAPTPGDGSEPTVAQTVLLMARVAKTGPCAYHAVLDAKFLDIVLSIKEEPFLLQELADIYRALLHFATRPEFQNRPVGMTSLNLLVRSIASSTETFIGMYSHWTAEEMKVLIEGVVRVLAPTWYFRFRAQNSNTIPQFVKIEKMKEMPSFEMHFLQTFLVFLKRIAMRDSHGCLALVQAGYLDILISLREVISEIAQNQDEVVILLHVLREQNARKYTDEEKCKALDLLFFHDSLREMTRELCHKLSSWRPDEYRRMLGLLLNKLRYVVRDGAKGSSWKCDQDRLILSVMYFLSRLAWYSGDMACQVVVSAGYLDILRFLQAHGFDIRPVIEELNVALQVLRPSNAALRVTDRHRSNALRLILHEICSGNGLYLHPQLEHWTTEDLCGFAKLLVSELNSALKTRPETLMLSWEYKTYFCAFIDQISAQDPCISHAVDCAGYMDVVFSVHQDSMDVKSAFSDMSYTENDRDSKPFSFSPCVSLSPGTHDLRSSSSSSSTNLKLAKS